MKDNELKKAIDLHYMEVEDLSEDMEEYSRYLDAVAHERWIASKLELLEGMI